MTDTAMPAPAALLLLAAAGLTLLLEVTGAGPGERKRVPRLHHAVVVAAAGLSAFALAPTWAHAATALALGLFALVSGTSLLGERAALALLLSAGVVALPSPSPPSALLAFLALWAAVTAGLCARTDDDAAAEAATKTAVIGVVSTLLLGTGLVVQAAGASEVGQAVVVTALALGLGAPPLQGLRVDVAHGAPVAAVVLAAPLSLWVLGPALGAALVEGPARWRPALDAMLGLALFALPLVALAQTSVRRVLAVLIAAQAALPLAAALSGTGSTAATFTAALGAAGLATSVAALPALVRPDVTWEDAAGQGRLYPWRAGLLVLAAAQACGLPPAAGFVVRARLAESLTATAPWVAAGLVVGAGLSAVPVVRLALFLFAKEPRRAPPPPPARGAVVGLVVVVALGLLAGLLLPR
jgi:formate hydrogenlyase subunit 3/multisubunit Na+/H+ antiporter MnhD subunit